MCAVCACISTVYYLRVKEKYLEKANEDYADEIRAKNRVPAKKKQDLEIMLRKMQSEVVACSCERATCGVLSVCLCAYVRVYVVSV